MILFFLCFIYASGVGKTLQNFATHSHDLSDCDFLV